MENSPVGFRQPCHALVGQRTFVVARLQILVQTVDRARVRVINRLPLAQFLEGGEHRDHARHAGVQRAQTAVCRLLDRVHRSITDYQLYISSKLKNR